MSSQHASHPGPALVSMAGLSWQAASGRKPMARRRKLLATDRRTLDQANARMLRNRTPGFLLGPVGLAQVKMYRSKALAWRGLSPEMSGATTATIFNNSESFLRPGQQHLGSGRRVNGVCSLPSMLPTIMGSAIRWAGLTRRCKRCPQQARGSIPSIPHQRTVRLLVRSPVFHTGQRGS